jgi:hypothetical protein
MPNSHDDQLKVLLLNDRGPWVAICLNYDLAAQGDSSTKALEALNWTYWAQVQLDLQKGIAPFTSCETSPRMYWERFDGGLRFAASFEFKPPFQIDHGEPPSVPEDVRLAA